MDDKKKGLAIIIAGKAKENEKSEDSDTKYKEMAQEILDAIEKKNAKALGMALKNFIIACE